MSKIDLNEIINPKVTKFPRFKPKLKIAILASGKGTNFETIIYDINNTIYKNGSKLFFEILLKFDI